MTLSMTGATQKRAERSMFHDTRPRVFLVGLVVIVLAGWSFFRVQRVGEIHADPPLSAEALSATPDTRLIFAAATELRWHIAAELGRLANWRDLDEVPRSVLALSWVETGEPDPRAAIFRGFGAFLAVDAPNRPTPEDLAIAYETIGAHKAASICRQVQELSDHDVVIGGERCAMLDNAFLRARSADATVARLNAYIRQNVADIADLRHR